MANRRFATEVIIFCCILILFLCYPQAWHIQHIYVNIKHTVLGNDKLVQHCDKFDLCHYISWFKWEEFTSFFFYGKKSSFQIKKIHYILKQIFYVINLSENSLLSTGQLIYRSVQVERFQGVNTENEQKKLMHWVGSKFPLPLNTDLFQRVVIYIIIRI